MTDATRAVAQESPRPANRVTGSRNADAKVIDDFSSEWSTFDQSRLSDSERLPLFDEYFTIFPWQRLGPHAVGFDLGCGSGRWAVVVASRVGHLHCIDPSDAIEVAKRNLQHVSNCSFHQATVDAIPLADGSMDFGYSLGVLHHVPDTQQGINDCVRKLKHGAPLLLYLYYAFDNQPRWYRLLWELSDVLRRAISSQPATVKYYASQVLAMSVYWPLARIARILSRAGVRIHSFPLGAYSNRSFYTMRTDALDKFGTRLEQRFTRTQIQRMMELAGLEDIQFSPAVPFWCAVGVKK